MKPATDRAETGPIKRPFGLVLDLLAVGAESDPLPFPLDVWPVHATDEGSEIETIGEAAELWTEFRDLLREEPERVDPDGLGYLEYRVTSGDLANHPDYECVRLDVLARVYLAEESTVLHDVVETISAFLGFHKVAPDPNSGGVFTLPGLPKSLRNTAKAYMMALWRLRGLIREAESLTRAAALYEGLDDVLSVEAPDVFPLVPGTYGIEHRDDEREPGDCYCADRPEGCECDTLRLPASFTASATYVGFDSSEGLASAVNARTCIDEYTGSRGADFPKGAVRFLRLYEQDRTGEDLRWLRREVFAVHTEWLWTSPEAERIAEDVRQVSDYPFLSDDTWSEIETEREDRALDPSSDMMRDWQRALDAVLADTGFETPTADSDLFFLMRGEHYSEALNHEGADTDPYGEAWFNVDDFALRYRAMLPERAPQAVNLYPDPAQTELWPDAPRTPYQPALEGEFPRDRLERDERVIDERVKRLELDREKERELKRKAEINRYRY